MPTSWLEQPLQKHFHGPVMINGVFSSEDWMCRMTKINRADRLSFATFSANAARWQSSLRQCPSSSSVKWYQPTICSFNCQSQNCHSPGRCGCGCILCSSQRSYFEGGSPSRCIRRIADNQRERKGSSRMISTGTIAEFPVRISSM